VGLFYCYLFSIVVESLEVNRFKGRNIMKKLSLALVLSVLTVSQVMAQTMCPEAKEAAQNGGISVEDAIEKYCK